MKSLISRCTLCGRTAHQRCRHCNTPICPRCQVTSKGKVYCSTRHRDQDAGPGHILRDLTRSYV